MFATGGRTEPPLATPGDEDDEWLRVGRSFKSTAPTEAATVERSEQRALQVYTKQKKESKRNMKKTHKSSKKKKSSSFSSDSESSSDRQRKHKRSKRSKKHRDAKHKKHHRNSSRTRRERSEYSDSSSSYGSSDSEGERRLVKKRRRRDGDGDRDRDRDRRDDSSALTLVESPPHGEMEVYRHHQQKLGEEKLFEFDCVGDRDNSFYGSLSKAEQPLYRLATRRSVVDGQWIVERPKRVDSTDKKSSDERFEARYFGSEAKKAERRQGARRLHLAYSERRLKEIARGDDGSQKEIAFIPLGVVVEGELNAGEESDNGDADDEDGGFQTLWKTDQENVEQLLVAKSKQLNERVNDQPTDVDAWLDLISFQDEMQQLSGKSSRRGAESVNAVVLEKQCVVLAKALAHNPESKDLRRLQLNMLWSEQNATHGRTVDVDSYRALVEQMLEKDPTNTDLWTKLIMCAQQKFGSFSMTMLRDLYARVVAVLNKELIRLVQEEKAVARPSVASASSFIHVVGNESLLGKTDPFASPMGEAVAALSSTLLMFHQSMVRAEVSAGYRERAVAQLQALIDFNSFCFRDGAFASSNQSVLEKFSAAWTDASSHFGDDACSSQGELFQPSPSCWESSYTTAIQATLDKVNPPPDVYSRAHMLSLIAPYGVDEDEDTNFSPDSAEANTGVAQDETTPKGQWVYSNLHGQRIWVADASEASSYERILDELRGSERFQERQQVQERKISSKKDRRVSLLAKLCDQRAEYPFITPAEDSFLRWLANESLADRTQWRPLRSSNPDHSSLIELQPDRAILTEEILPFVFRVPRVLHNELVLNFLDVLGVRLTRGSVGSSPWAQASDDFDSWPVLTQPILDALDASSDSPIAMTSQGRYALVMKALQQNVTVDAAAALDPERVQFIRNVFASAIDEHEKIDSDGDVCRLFKVIWMEYEAEVTQKSGEAEASAGKLRAFCQQLLQPQQTNKPPDSLLLSVYAAIELRQGQASQGLRVCDKTMASLSLHDSGAVASTPRAFHRLIFLRVQQTLFDSNINDESRRLHMLYSLWQPWEPETTDSLERIMKHHRKKPQDLIQCLQKIRDDHKDQVVERYRLELSVSLQQCEHRSSKPSRSTALLGCEVPFAVSNLCSALYAVHGFHAALSEYKLFLEQCRLDRSTCCHSRLCWLACFAFIQGHQSTGGFPQLAPREWRSIVGTSVAVFPLDEVCLRLFVDAESSNTISQTLRKHFETRRQSWRRYGDSPEMIEWLFALLCELARAERFGLKFLYTDDTRVEDSTRGAKCCLLHKWGKNRPAAERIRRVFEEMVDQVNTIGNAVAWRLFLRFELAVGRVDAARKVFYRGLVKCPWSKALYLDGLRVLRPYLSHDECQELSDFMVAKELHVRIEDQE